MGLGDIFKAKENQQLKDDNQQLQDKNQQLQDENQHLEEEIKRLNSLVTPEMLDVNEAKKQLESIRNDIKEANELYSDRKRLAENMKNQVILKEREIIQLDDEILFQSFGIYRPQYNFCNSEKYKTELDKIRQHQKDLIKKDLAATGATNWTVNGDHRKGAKMVNDTKKLVLRAFNGECDELVSKVKYNNYEAYKKRIEASCDAISKLGKVMDISITEIYKQYKIDELTLAFEYAQKKQQEKEEQAALRAQMREEAKLQKEIEEERKKLEKEQTHYTNALEKLNKQLAADPDNVDLINKKQELESAMSEIETAIKDVDYREANKRAGYVYVISNIGAFGENVYKIGMTRRLDPMERVDELGDASVPFNFDVHAMIFTDDAPALEAALHKAFEDKKLNMVNQRREFFNVTLDEIKAVVKANYDKTVEFVDIPDAEQYRVSLKMKQQQPV